MAAIGSKAEALGGRGVVFTYVTDSEKWYYRELIPGTKKYKTKLIPSVTTLEEALAGCLDVCLSMQGEAPRRRSQAPIRHKNLTTVVDAVNDYLAHEAKRVEAGLLAETTYYLKTVHLGKHFLRYLDSIGVKYTNQITEQTLEDYPIFRKHIGKYTRKKEIVTIGTFINAHLIRHNLITPEAAMSKTLLPKVRMKQTDFDANPAINEADWQKINLYIRTKYVKAGEQHNSRTHHWRVLFWTFTVVAKNTGCRPNELLKLRWKDVEIENIGRWSESKQETEDRFIAYLTVSDSKTGLKRQVPANIGSALIRWMKFRIIYMKNHMPKEYELMGVNMPDQLVFGNPHNEFRSYSLNTYQQSWREVRTALQDQLKGHKFSDKPYTIYSMRATFIENKLLEGMDIFLLARVCGHSVKVLMTHYERLDIRKRAEEITHIEYGRTKKKMKIVDVLTE